VQGTTRRAEKPGRSAKSVSLATAALCLAPILSADHKVPWLYAVALRSVGPPGFSCAGELALPKLSDLNLGVLLPLTGDWPEARTFIGAIRVVQEDIMANPSILGRKLEIKYIWKDDACSSQKSSASLGEILDDLKRRNLELSGLIGPACSAGCENTAFTTGEKKIVQISYSCASATLADNLKYPTVMHCLPAPRRL